jgi:hypothetical protein
MNRSAKARPGILRALGPEEPPAMISLAGRDYRRVEVFKHDSWAATARYQGDHGDVVCKFNRVHPILLLPLGWLGRWLAQREAMALRHLAHLPGIPRDCGPVVVAGKTIESAVAHLYIPGHPLGCSEMVGDAFFEELIAQLAAIHRSDVAYVDLHKRENIIVGEDGRPYLVDFQICYGLWHRRSRTNNLARAVLRLAQQADWYHLAKHFRRLRPDQQPLLRVHGSDHRPWWIHLHRVLAVPFREGRRRMLAKMGVRHGRGRAESELFPEEAVRLAQKHAA